MPNVDLTRVPSYYHKYINKVDENELQDALKKSQAVFISTLRNIPTEKWDYRYAEDKWTVKELVQHIIDSERIFCFRALCFARKDKTPLPGFDENLYAKNCNASIRKGEELIEELISVQNSTFSLFTSFDQEQLDQSGVANNNPVYVKGIGFIIAGHANHHLDILKERYLNEPVLL
jgi:hypothetical protein